MKTGRKHEHGIIEMLKLDIPDSGRCEVDGGWKVVRGHPTVVPKLAGGLHVQNLQSHEFTFLMFCFSFFHRDGGVEYGPF